MYRLRIARRGRAVDHRQHARRRASVQGAGQRPDRRRQHRCAVGAGRRSDARGEGRGVEAVLGRCDPVGVERLHVLRIGLAPPASKNFAAAFSPGDLRFGDRGPPAARRLSDDRQRRRREPARSSRPACRRCRRSSDPPLRPEVASAALQVGRTSRWDPEANRLRRRKRRADVLVDEEAPDVLERVAARRAPRCRLRDTAASRRLCPAPRSPSRTRRPPRDPA